MRNQTEGYKTSCIRIPAMILLISIAMSLVLFASGCSSSSSSGRGYTDSEYERAREAVINANNNYYGDLP